MKDMASPVAVFTDAAVGLTKNPLGIIGLFIVLVYSVAALVPILSKNLNSDQIWAFTLFLVIFPVLILFVFGYLVTHHHRKLYSPRDYRDDSSFLDVASLKEQKEKNDSAEIKTDSQKEISTKITVEPPHKSRFTLDPKFQKIRQDSLFAEELAMRALESELGVFIKRNVKLGSNGTVFDGVLTLKDKIKIIELRYIQSSAQGYIGFLLRRRLELILTRCMLVKSEFNTPVTLIFVFVLKEKTDSKEIVSQVQKISTNSPIPIETRVYHLDELKNKFGV